MAKKIKIFKLDLNNIQKMRPASHSFDTWRIHCKVVAALFAAQPDTPIQDIRVSEEDLSEYATENDCHNYMSELKGRNYTNKRIFVEVIVEQKKKRGI